MGFLFFTCSSYFGFSDPHTLYVERLSKVDFTTVLHTDFGYFLVRRKNRKTFLSFFDQVGAYMYLGDSSLKFAFDYVF